MKSEKELLDKIFLCAFPDKEKTVSEIEKEQIELIRQAKSKWCKEQRKICNERANFSIINGIYVINENSILDAPEPE